MSKISEKFQMPFRYAGNEKSFWIEYMQLALEHKALNLGQGFTDDSPPKYVTEALQEVTKSDNYLIHQYTRSYGHPRLVRALAQLYSHLIKREINPETEILITVGAYEALYVSITSHTEIGDEVIIIEPFFDCYASIVKVAGGVGRFVSLKLQRKSDDLITSADWVYDKNELENAFSSRTKIIVLNNPLNPVGKTFTREELEHIAHLCKKWNVLCISDEVYEWIVYKPNVHIRIATLPGMWERTITIGSAAKTLSVTGWRVGWAYGPANLMVHLQIAHQNLVYTGSTPMQEAIAICIEKELTRLDQPECYFNSVSEELVVKRDYMVKILSDVGMKPTIPQGGYCILADWSPLESQVDLTSETDQYKDYRFTKWMIKNLGVQGIPTTAFYSEPNKHLTENFVRYCFFKKEENLRNAEEKLKKWKCEN